MIAKRVWDYYNRFNSDHNK